MVSITSTFRHLPPSSGPRAPRAEQLVSLFQPSNLSTATGQPPRARSKLLEKTHTMRTPLASRTRTGSPLSQATIGNQTQSLQLAQAHTTGTGSHFPPRSTISAPLTVATSLRISTLEEACSQGLGRQVRIRCLKENPLAISPLRCRILGTSGVASTGGISTRSTSTKTGERTSNSLNFRRKRS